MATINQIKQLRQETGVSAMDCKKALKEAGGNIERAKEILRKWGQDFALGRMGQETKQGIIETYLHPNKKVGVMVQLHSETDFVAKSEEFKKLAHELCLQIAAMNPLFLEAKDIPEKFLDGERKIYREQLKDSGKAQKIINQVIEGKLRKYKEEISLLSQSWIRDETKNIKDLVDEYIAKLGENIIIKRFSRYEI